MAIRSKTGEAVTMLAQAEQAVAVLAEAAAAAPAAHASTSGNGSGPAEPASAQSPDAARYNDSRGTASPPAAEQALDSRSSGNGSHPAEQPVGGRLPVLLCGDMNAEPDSSACEVRSPCCTSAGLQRTNCLAFALPVRRCIAVGMPLVVGRLGGRAAHQAEGVRYNHID